jgi:hypothetical protein
LIDPVAGAGVEDRVRRAGEPAGVIQLLDRHGRDCRALAERLGVPHHVVPREELGPFAFVPIRSGRFWNEVALWWDEARVLVCGDALGTVDYFRAGRERLAVHPFLRLFPPRRALEPLRPERVLCGHGEGINDDADGALHEALRTARLRLLSALLNVVRVRRRRASA